MPGPSPVQPLQGFVTEQNPFAPPEVRHGGPADPVHGQWGEATTPWPWQAYGGSLGPPPSGGIYAQDNRLLGVEPEYQTMQAGYLAQDPQGDLTPYRTHAGPYIKGLPNTTDPEQAAGYLAQSWQAHGPETNADKRSQYAQTMVAQQDHWVGFFNLVPGEDLVQPAAGSQVSPAAFGFGVNDRTSNTMHKANQYGYNTSHRHRRYAAGSIPGNYMWMRPGSRPMSKSQAGPARPAVGAGPFYGQDTTQDFNPDGAILQQDPRAYVSPPQPYVAPATQGGYGDAAPPIDFY